MENKLKEEARKIIIKDTRRVYISTEANPDGELITDEEFDDFIDYLITKAYEEGINNQKNNEKQ